MSSGDDKPTNGVPASEDPTDPIERLRTYILQKLLRGVPRGEIEDELIGKGYDVQYAIQIVDSVKRNAERKAGAGELQVQGELLEFLELPPPVHFAEAQEQLEGLAVFSAPPGSPKVRPRSENVPRLFFVLSIIGLVLLVLGLFAESRFWFVWLSGGRAAGTVTLVEDRVVLRPYTRRSTNEGKGYDLKATYIEYTFPTADGQEKGHVWLDSTSKAWTVGMPIDVMYSRFDVNTNMPASLQFRIDHDTSWFMAQFAAVLGVVLIAAGVLGRRHSK
jgi:hypothetical protein